MESKAEINETIVNKLYKEYYRYETTQNILKSFCQHGCDNKEKYEAKNILERWLLTSSNLIIKLEGQGEQDPVYSRLLVKEPDHVLNKQMVQELVNKRIKPNEAAAKKLLMSILKTVEIFLNNMSENKLPAHIKNAEVEVRTFAKNMVNIKYLSFEKDIFKPRFDILLKKGSLDEIMISALRYGAIISSSQHWNMPLENYQRYVRDYQVSIEGFASPFNSQLLMVDENAKFCSLFKDVDAVFGSLGSFFEADFQGATVAVNPPYVLDIIDKMTDKCITECQKAKESGGKVRFLIIFSAWRDTYAYETLSKTEFLKYTMETEPGHHFYVDSNNPDPKEGPRRIPARFTTVLFVLSQGFDDSSSDYVHALDDMKLKK